MHIRYQNLFHVYHTLNKLHRCACNLPSVAACAAHCLCRANQFYRQNWSMPSSAAQVTSRQACTMHTLGCANMLSIATLAAHLPQIIDLLALTVACVSSFC